MPAYKKPEPREKGRTKDAKEKRRSAPRWKTTEREHSRWLQDNYGVDDDPVIKHLKTSTGRIGHLVSLGADSTSAHAVGESKDRNAVPIWLQKLWSAVSASDEPLEAEHELPKWMADAWAQIHQYAATRLSKRRPVLFLSYGKGKRPTFVLNGKETPLPDMHVINKEHHEELIKGWLGINAIKQLCFSDEFDASNMEDFYNRVSKIVDEAT